MTEKASEAMAWLKMASGNGWICPCGTEKEPVETVGYGHAVMLHAVLRALEAEVARLTEHMEEGWNDGYAKGREYWKARAERAEAEAEKQTAWAIDAEAEVTAVKARLAEAESGLREVLEGSERVDSMDWDGLYDRIERFLSRGPDGRDSGRKGAGSPKPDEEAATPANAAPDGSAAANSVGVAPTTFTTCGYCGQPYISHGWNEWGEHVEKSAALKRRGRAEDTECGT